MRRSFPLRRFGVVVALATGAALTAACPSLDEIPLDECGNGVVEASIGEDCDAAPEAGTSRREGKSYCARANETNACHYVWDDTTCCPARLGAGVDGRCRKPSGEFVKEPILSVDQPTLGLGNADIDGDGYSDLAVRFANREIELRFLGPDADKAPVRDVRPSEENSQATFGNLSNPVEPAPDVCGRPTAFRSGAVFVPGTDGVRVLLGSDAGLLPRAFPTFRTPGRSLPIALPLSACFSFPVPPPIPPQLDCPGALGVVDGGIRMLAVDANAEVEANPAIFQTDFPGLSLEDIVAPFHRVRVPEWEGCDAVAITFAGSAPEPYADTTTVLGLCTPGAAEDEPKTTVLARIEAPRRSRTFVLDVNADGADDVVVGDGEALRVRLGDGAGSFGEEGAGAYDIPIGPTEKAPVVVGFLNDDDQLDYALGEAVYVSLCSGDAGDEGDEGGGGGAGEADGCEYIVASSFAVLGELKGGVVADVNGDGLHDVVGPMRSGSPAVTPALAVITSSANGLYTLDARPTADEPRDLWPGDFDGDGSDDVVMAVGLADSCAEPTEVQVLYGEDGLPGELVTVTRIPGIQGLATGLISPGFLQLDGIDDIGLTTTCPDGADGFLHQAALLFGNQSRGVDSPYQLAGIRDEWAARTLFATGRVLPGDTHPDLVALGLSDDKGEYAIWRIEARGDAELPPGGPDEAYQPVPTGLSDATAAVALAVDDLDCGPDADPIACASDEIIVFQSSGASELSTLADEPRLTIFGAGAELLVSAVTGPCPDVPGSSAFLAAAGVDPDAAEVALNYDFVSVFDVDGDGYRDVVAWWFGVDPLVGIVAGDAFVFWNGPAGLGGTCPARIASPDGPIVAMSPFDVGEERPWFAIATAQGVSFANVGEDKNLEACAPGADGTRCQRVPDVTGITTMSVLDYDHDGLDDLAVGGPAGIRIYKQRAADEVIIERSASGQEPDEDDD